MSYRIVTPKLIFANGKIANMLADRIHQHTRMRFRVFNEERVNDFGKNSAQLVFILFGSTKYEVEFMLKNSAQKIVELIDQYAVEVEGDLILNVHTVDDNAEPAPTKQAFAFV